MSEPAATRLIASEPPKFARWTWPAMSAAAEGAPPPLTLPASAAKGYTIRRPPQITRASGSFTRAGEQATDDRDGSLALGAVEPARSAGSSVGMIEHHGARRAEQVSVLTGVSECE